MTVCHTFFTVRLTPFTVRLYAASPMVKVAVYPPDGLPDTVASSEFKLSAKMLSRVFVVGLEPRDAYTPVPCTSLFTESGKAICVTFSDCPLRVTST